MVSAPDARSIKHPRSIAIVNYKGGVGKTTVTYLLGLYLTLQTARRTLIIDIDAQCSLTFAVGFEPDEVEFSKENIYNLVKPQAWPTLRKTQLNDFAKPVPGIPAPLYIVPGAFKVEDLDIEITEALFERRERSKSEFFLYCRQLVNSFDDFHYVLVDTPPNKMYLTQAMLRASQYYLPVTIPDGISIYGMPRLLRWITQIDIEERPHFIGYILNTVNRSGGSPAGMVTSQQVASFTLDARLNDIVSRSEKARIDNELCLGNIPRLDQIARFMGSDKDVRLDFARHTSSQPTVDNCMKSIASSLLTRLESYDA